VAGAPVICDCVTASGSAMGEAQLLSAQTVLY
jgi:hypothetical protein